MKYGFVIPGGEVEDWPEMAHELEEAGWDAVFVAETVYGIDAWTALAAMAMKTERLLLGTLLTPPSRRRPWKLASEIATLDHLSHGRALLTAGLGAIDTGFVSVGEKTDRKERAELLDETLDLLNEFWRGGHFHYHGKHYQVNWDVNWLYKPVQSPRVPIWVVAAWPRELSMRRALRCDGIVPSISTPESKHAPMTPEAIREIKAYCDEKRSNKGQFDIVVEGVTPVEHPDSWADTIKPFAEAGATWWVESMWEVPGGMEVVRKRAKMGPPRV